MARADTPPLGGGELLPSPQCVDDFGHAHSRLGKVHFGHQLVGLESHVRFAAVDEGRHEEDEVVRRRFKDTFTMDDSEQMHGVMRLAGVEKR